MDYKNLTAPCGRDCFNCYFYLASNDEKLKHMMASKLNLDPEKVVCTGCRNIKGDCQVLRNYGFIGKCKIYQCVEKNKVEFCSDCSDFPCDLLQPLADGADRFPHNLKVFNLCMIKKMGLDNWAKNKSKQIFDRYYHDKLDTCI
ncbi:MAG: DUF3795 domain-containing protein [Bacteroidota bacterium]|nr:DUF3795 domain-containing protein [Bacteroidota bacterium]